MSDFESGMAESVIVGIGVNISTEKFPEEISGIAGSVGVFAERSRLCADIAWQAARLRRGSLVARAAGEIPQPLAGPGA